MVRYTVCNYDQRKLTSNPRLLTPCPVDRLRPQYTEYRLTNLSPVAQKTPQVISNYQGRFLSNWTMFELRGLLFFECVRDRPTEWSGVERARQQQQGKTFSIFASPSFIVFAVCDIRFAVIGVRQCRSAFSLLLVIAAYVL